MRKEKTYPFYNNRMSFVDYYKETQFVVAIIYRKNIPFEIITASCQEEKTPYIPLSFWDAFPNGGDKKDVRLYNSGGGGYKTFVDAPHFTDGSDAEYWLAPGIEFVGDVKNCKRLENPKRLYGYFGSSINPFKIYEECGSMEFCKECNAWHGDDYCIQHLYEDEDGQLRYRSDNSIND